MLDDTRGTASQEIKPAPAVGVESVFAQKVGGVLAERSHGRIGWAQDGTMMIFCQKSTPAKWCTVEEFRIRKEVRGRAIRAEHWRAKQAGYGRHGSRGHRWAFGCHALG